MKISLNWLKKYVNIPKEITNEELIRLIGARLVEVEGVIDESHKYDNIYIVRVEKAEKISETHLTLCQVNNGGSELIQVVCGAPNVQEGMLAVWIAPGAVVPASVHEDAPFVIGKRKMLGKYESNGMLAGADELDFGGDHSGIAEINPESAKPGDKLADVFNLNDLVLEIENKSLTHRPDCFGIIGFSREVSGILGQSFEEPDFLLHEEVFPEGFLEETKDGVQSRDNDLRVEITDVQICPRYTCALLKVNEATGQSRYLSEMQVLLAKSGMTSKSKVVDATNYLMLLTGQPLHAFDYDKFLKVGGKNEPNIIVRLAKSGEKLELLDGKIVECVDSDILITSNDVPVALAGAMGGKNTEIDENTKNVLLESASFSLYNLRKTQMTHGIFSEAITRFTKGVPAGGTFNVLAEAVKEINGKPLALCDRFLGRKGSETIKISADEINGLLGTQYSQEKIVKTLGNVGFLIKENQNELNIIAPLWRTDIHIKEDIIEEVGRLLGYDNIEPTLPLHKTAEKNRMFSFKSDIREKMLRFGANEVLTYSFVSENLLEKSYQDKKNSYKIINSISPALQYMRQSLVPSLLDKAYLNEKLPVEKFAIYEINKVHQKKWGVNEEGVPIEKMHMGFVVAERKNNNTAYYKAKRYVDELFNAYGIGVQYVPLKAELAAMKPFEPLRSAEIRLKDNPDVLLGVVGEFRNSVKDSFKLAEYLAGFEVDLDLILEHAANKKDIVVLMKEKRDLTVITDKTYGEIVDGVEKILDEYGVEAKISPVSIYQSENEKDKHITIHLEFTDFKEEVMEKLEKL
ncbi:phenylalanine--tRNA ligase subunit beta [Candidatus Saccharibacteria bacterium]|nr:phenylalanine--tRNA ligase subunit beta [Candidatus Saccharibacteria bacterium]